LKRNRRRIIEEIVRLTGDERGRKRKHQAE
jgi:hypothetical protein